MAVHRQGRNVEVFEDRHTAKGTGHLEGSARTRPRHLVGRKLVGALTVQLDGAAVGLDRRVQNIGERGLARAIGPTFAAEPQFRERE